MANLWEPVSGVFWKAAPLLPNMDSLKNLGDSSLFTTVFGALAGAFFGAWAAQRIAQRSKLREELQRELRSTNKAIMLANSTTNLGYALKKQHIKGLRESYAADCEKKDQYQELKKAGHLPPPLEISPNLSNLSEISPPIVALQEIVLGQLSTAGRALAAVMALADGISNMNRTITKRNDLIERFKEGRLPDGAKIYHFYLGLPYAEGEVNREYGDIVDALARYNDDAIFFGVKLMNYLQEHGRSITKKYEKEFGEKLSKLSQVDLRKAEEEDLIPSDDQYKSWLSGYQFFEVETEAPRWWQLHKKAAECVDRWRAK